MRLHEMVIKKSICWNMNAIDSRRKTSLSTNSVKYSLIIQRNALRVCFVHFDPSLYDRPLEMGVVHSR